MKIEKLTSEIITLGEFSTVEVLHKLISNCSTQDYIDHLSFCDQRYKKNKLFQNKHFEVVLICWKPFQATKFHGHPQNGCIMKILKGELLEIRKSRNKEFENTLKSNDVSFISKNEIHKIQNKSVHAVSLHIYSPSGYYERVDTNNIFEQRKATAVLN